jgi:hypothetical protein
MNEYRVFVSYSRMDVRIVVPLVQLLRVIDERVFRDLDSIPPGSLWRANLSSAIDGCQLLLVFWCRHASSSGEVETEYRQAIAQKKSVVPIILDNTNLTAELSEYQAIDLRQMLGDHQEVHADEAEGVSGARTRGSSTQSRWEVLVPNDRALHDASWCLREALGKILNAGPGGRVDREPAR